MTRAWMVGVALVATVAACSPASTGMDATAAGAAGAARTDPARADAGPDPAVAWTFDRGGAADVGGADLTMSGTWEGADGAVSLDGGTGYAASAAPGPVVTTESFTVAAWVGLPPPRLLGQQVYATAVSQAGSVAAAFYLGTAADGRWSFAMKDADTSEPGHTVRAVADPAEPDADTWVHLVGSFDADDGEIRLHVDGEPVAQEPFDAPWQAEGPLLVGRALAHGVPSDFWPGAVADVRAFDSALDTEDVGRLLDATRPTSPPPGWPTVEGEVTALNGTFEYRMTPEESTQLGATFGDEAAAAGFPGEATTVLRFVDGLWQLYFLVDDVPYLVDGRAEGDGGWYTVDGDRLVVNDDLRYRWSIDGDVLSLTLLGDPPGAEEIRFVTERAFTRSGS